jgi:hypothetical protein
MTAPDGVQTERQATLQAPLRQVSSTCCLAFGLLLAGCVVRQERTGMVEASADRVFLAAYQGGRTPLVLGESAAPVRFLAGCAVEVVGVPTPAGFVVNDWRVTDAGDGSGGFVGMLRAWGARLLVEDRNTGGRLMIDAEAVPELRRFVDQPGLLVGTIVGRDTVAVVAYRVLSEEGRADAR